MSYLNDTVGYRKGLLSNRSIIKPGKYALLEPDGLVKNTIPGFENCDVTILGSPKLGASFVDYLVTIPPGGRNEAGFGADGVETLLYLIEGDMQVRAGTQPYPLKKGGFVYCPPGTRLYFNNESGQRAKAFMYKRIYLPLPGVAPYVVVGNTWNGRSTKAWRMSWLRIFCPRS